MFVGRRLLILPIGFCLALAWACGGDVGELEPIDLTCESDTPVLQESGAESGFSSCDERITHRVSAATCDVPEAPDPTVACESSSGVEGSCAFNADCTEGAHGICVDDTDYVDPSTSQGCHCEYSCATDDDCSGDNACVCLGERPRCMAGECATDDDCDGLCIMKTVSGECGGSSSGLVCLDPDDECIPGYPSTCPEIPDCNGGMSAPPCEHGSKGWTCGEFECATSCG